MSRRDTARRLREVMESEGDTVGGNVRGKNARTGDAIAAFPEYETLRDRAREIKEDAIADLPDLIDEVTESVEANGGRVHLARDADAAVEYVASVVEDADGDRVVKSKSMTTEEIDLNEGLEPDAEVFETDLGEFVVQVADESPSHLVGPAMHRTPDEIARLFDEHLDPDEELTGDPQQLTEFAREYVGDRIRRADVGVTGANFVVAESGSILLVTNEGNARKTAVTPDVHVAVAGVEKIVPTIPDLQPFVELIARTATGQELTSYLSLLTPPVETPTVDFGADQFGESDREFHLVLVDNGRMAMREDDQLRETLYCIRCGACANACSNFQSVGGHAFGGETYTGGIATGWETGVHGIESAAEFNDLCTGCSRCVEKCPVKIDIPWINTVVRDRLNRGKERGDLDFLVEGLAPDEEPARLDPAKRVFGNVDRLARVGSALAPVSNWLADRETARALLERAVGIDRRRELPRFADVTLREWYGARGTKRPDADREVVLYPDIYTNYFLPERGRAAVRTLEALDVEVHVPSLPESGRAPLSQGMVSTASNRASDLYAGVVEHLDAGRDLVVVEPSDLAMVHEDYSHLLPERSFDRLAGDTYGVMEYVYGLLEQEGRDVDALRDADDALQYHGHCQGRTVGSDDYDVAVLEAAGYDVRTTDVECCGMAGSFGYKVEYHDVSRDAGDHLAANGEWTARRPVAPGASCREQLRAVLDGSPGVPHPVELLDPGRE